MEKAYKQTSKFLFNLLNTCISILKVMLVSKKAAVMPAPAADTCIILGNGPSLKTSLKKNPAHFSNKPLLCVNTFSLTEEFVQLQPTYYMILDQGFWLGDDATISNTMNAIRDKTSWPLYVIVPFSARTAKVFDIVRQNENIRILYFNYVVFKGFDRIAYYFYKRNRAIMQSQNVLVAAVFIAINLGFKRVELFGADYSWHENVHVGDDNIVSMKHVHFYENAEQLEYIPISKGRHLTARVGIDELFYGWARNFQGHMSLQKYAKARGARIFNASDVSYIDAYERMKL